MGRIWHGEVTLGSINDLNKGSLGEHFGIVFTELGDDHIVAEMQVNEKTKQPFGLLHGGATVALAETLGSVASWCCVNREHFIGVGVEINANHLKSVTGGKVVATCKPLKVGGKVHVWEIRVNNSEGELISICRFTCMIVPSRKSG